MATARLRPVERLAGKSVRHILGAHHVDQAFHNLNHLVFGQPAPLAQRKGDILPHAHRVEQRAVLEDHRDALADGVHALFVEAGDLLALEPNRPRIGLEKAHQQAQGHRFAHAAAAQDAQRLSALNLKAHILKHRAGH